MVGGSLATRYSVPAAREPLHQIAHGYPERRCNVSNGGRAALDGRDVRLCDSGCGGHVVLSEFRSISD